LFFQPIELPIAAKMTRGNQREKAREKNLKEQGGAVSGKIRWGRLYQTKTNLPHLFPSAVEAKP
jgi:4F5 protein related disordered region